MVVGFDGKPKKVRSGDEQTSGDAGRPRVALDEEQLVLRYREGASIRMLADEAGRAYATIHKRLKEFGVLRSRGEGRNATMQYQRARNSVDDLRSKAVASTKMRRARKG